MPLGRSLEVGIGLVADRRPLLLLDVDGVLNPFAADDCPEGYREHAFFPEDESPVRLCDAHGPWLNDLAQGFDLVWATGWEDEANTFITPVLSLPLLPVVRFPPAPFDAAEKVPAIDAFADGRPAAWVDDAHAPEAWAWADARVAPTMLVATDPSRGLTAKTVEELLCWRTSL
ncbi:HAD domain-containing protein [Streptomyces sp. YIM 130001]|uniref:HAD domain-containing protein n=1 Tax=Streptomyces sp. YIM 130001 TaxID=2259644 RepID=UPI000E64B1F6|nr:HAD domain-containing protein [Streptomyces sp. YIM 130001]